MKLDDNILRAFSEDALKKDVFAVNEPELVREFFKYIQMNNEFMGTTSAYEIASTMRSYSSWYENKDIQPKHVFASQREVYYVDLGAFNLKYEEGYIHPCVVVKRYGTSVLVIPGSSKSYGKTNDLIFDIQSGNGFRSDTGLFLDQIRCVSTTRLISKLGFGKVTTDIFDKILDKVIQKFFSQKFDEYTQLKNKNNKQQLQLDQQKQKLEILREENDKLKLQIKQYKEVPKNELVE